MSLGGSIGRYEKCSLDRETIRRESWPKQSKLEVGIFIRARTFIALPTCHHHHNQSIEKTDNIGKEKTNDCGSI
ncbi:uncharacterized protein BO66DRAFT_73395 [Aspergillus aculeatinus CBS 121060]|uniref:Uncharacterized protein n=1 Tax=Aspergillus aculeatinus CBS 121060 TaxID=1448322 RepID=A0ACD1HBP3_9EURO|nr:hypothetical protein BO66DRAFT_73395 [Aspergillus aculeatinus CBS 121060]RAH70843.1 hypothetical protein BO66DRAFT_73395 [Aspergillus aculeatinus CBS 121060]